MPAKSDSGYFQALETTVCITRVASIYKNPKREWKLKLLDYNNLNISNLSWCSSRCACRNSTAESRSKFRWPEYSQIV